MTKLLYKENYAYLQKAQKELVHKEEVLNNLALRMKGLALNDLDNPIIWSIFYGLIGIVLLGIGIFILFPVIVADTLSFDLKLSLLILGIIFLILALGVIKYVIDMRAYNKEFFLRQYQDLIQYGKIIEAKVLSNIYRAYPENHRIIYEIISPKGEVSKATHHTRSENFNNIKKDDTIYLLYLTKKVNTLL